MFTFLLFIINFIIIFILIKLIVNKYSKYKINKFTISNDSLSRKRQSIFNNIVIGLNILYLFLNAYFKSNSLIMTITMPIIAVLDIIAVIILGVFVRLQGGFKK